MRGGSRVQAKLDAANITSEQLNEWKEKNEDKVLCLNKMNNGKKCKAMDGIINCIINE